MGRGSLSEIWGQPLAAALWLGVASAVGTSQSRGQEQGRGDPQSFALLQLFSSLTREGAFSPHPWGLWFLRLPREEKGGLRVPEPHSHGHISAPCLLVTITQCLVSWCPGSSVLWQDRGRAALLCPPLPVPRYLQGTYHVPGTVPDGGGGGGNGKGAPASKRGSREPVAKPTAETLWRVGVQALS